MLATVAMVAAVATAAVAVVIAVAPRLAAAATVVVIVVIVAMAATAAMVATVVVAAVALRLAVAKLPRSRPRPLRLKLLRPRRLRLLLPSFKYLSETYRRTSFAGKLLRETLLAGAELSPGARLQIVKIEAGSLLRSGFFRCHVARVDCDDLCGLGSSRKPGEVCRRSRSMLSQATVAVSWLRAEPPSLVRFDHGSSPFRAALWQ